MAESNSVRSPELMSAAESRLLIVDMQEKFMPTIQDSDVLVANCVTLLEAAQILGVPAFTTEQYPKGLGVTVPALQPYLPVRPDKLRFSCAEALGWSLDGTQIDERRQVVIAGIETHVCVLQTAFDLLSIGFDVFLIVDALRSRFVQDHETALRRLADSGARLATVEMALFEWCEAAGSDEFKKISKLITQRVRPR